MDEGHLQQLVGRAYDAAIEPRLWNGFLEDLGRTVNTPALSIGIHSVRPETHAQAPSITYEELVKRWNQDPTPETVVAATGFDPRMMERYNEYYVELEPWTHIGGPSDQFSFASSGVERGQPAVPISDLVRTEFYNDWMKPQDLHFSLAALPSSSPLCTVATFRSQRAGQYEDVELEVVRTLVPHLRRAVRIHLELSAARQARDAAGEVLDRLPIGVVLLDGNGRVQAANRSAESMFAARDGITVGHGELRGGRTQETRLLQRAIWEAARTGLGKGLGSGGAFSLPRPSRKRPYGVVVTPLNRESSGVLLASRPVVGVFVTDPEQETVTDIEALRRLLGLTRTEAKLAALLGNGCALHEAAELLHIRLSTARQHLKRVLAKTDTHRQGQLVRLVLTSLASLRRE